MHVETNVSNSRRSLENRLTEIRHSIYQTYVVIQLNQGEHPIEIRQGQIRLYPIKFNYHYFDLLNH